MRSLSSFDHGCLSGRASAYSLSSFKHVRTKDDEQALWANHMVRGGVSREDLAADNDISEFQVKKDNEDSGPIVLLQACYSLVVLS